MFNLQSSPFQPSGVYHHSDHAHHPDLAAFPLPNETGLFSRGSSLRYNSYDYSYFPAGADPATHTPSASTITINATGRKPVPPSGTGVHAQPIQNSRQSWQWTPAQAHAHTAPVPTTPNAYPSSRNNKKASSSRGPAFQSPVDDIPPSSSMAVMLSPGIIAGSASIPLPALPAASPQATRSTRTKATHCLGTGAVGHGGNNSVREKKHGCWMCHKSFDRPSTLRKHLLVHTGERAYVCETCGRRFGVASNLNRHVRRCLLRPMNSVTAGPLTTSPAEDLAQSTSPSTVAASHPATVQIPDPGPSSASVVVTAGTGPASGSAGTGKRKAKRTRTRSASPSESPNSSATSNNTQGQKQIGSSSDIVQRTAKRRRRAPSPSQWIPFSLLAFDLNPIEFHKSTPVPLPPVTPSELEERNSWDENVGAAPYRENWTGKLPGPGLGIGLGKRDVGNLGPGSGGFFMGRLSLSS